MNINELTIMGKGTEPKKGRSAMTFDVTISVNKNGGNGGKRRVIRVSFSYRAWCQMGKPQVITPAINKTKDMLVFLLDREDGYTCSLANRKNDRGRRYFTFDRAKLGDATDDFIGSFYLDRDAEGCFYITCITF